MLTNVSQFFAIFTERIFVRWIFLKINELGINILPDLQKQTFLNANF